MTIIELCADTLKGNLGFINMTLADFSDADMMTRPCPDANHAAWQIGHLIKAETGMTNQVAPGSMPELPADFAEKFSKENSKNDDPNFFPKKQALLDLFTKTRMASIAWAKSLTPADLDKPGPKGMESMVPRVGDLIMLMPVHAAMHVGQFQVIRRKLGKPILF